MNKTDTPLQATCHCGRISVTAPRTPEKINECQCTLCRRYGAAWAYYSPEEVKFSTADNGATRSYIWGDREIEFRFCDHCGCMMYWYPIDSVPNADLSKMGINTRMMNPSNIRFVDREFDFSQLRQKLGNPNAKHPDSEE